MQPTAKPHGSVQVWYNRSMSETATEPAQPKPAKKRLKVLDVVVFAVIGVVIVFLGATLASRLSLKNQVAEAQAVADRVIADIAKKDAKDARSLATKEFQAARPIEELNELFVAAGGYAKGTPTISRQTVATTENSDNVIFIYKYGGKQPYYFRVVVSKPAGTDTWKLSGLTGNSSETALVVK
jgi:hypothetical protein